MGAPEIRRVRLEWGDTVLAFIQAAAVMRMPDGRQVDEMSIIGPRSEGKSFGCLGAVLSHAKAHEAAGYPLPVPWLWFRDSFPNHEANLVKDVQRLEWQGIWRVSDGGRIIRCEMNGACQVEARLFGLEDISAVERMRGQAVGVYGEEPGPVIGASVSTGWTEAAWETALSSIGDKVQSHAYPAIIASNPSQRSHWFWKRFVLNPSPHVGTFRIPPGERTSDQYRSRLARIFRADPNLYTRLVEGEAAVAALGPSAVKGYHSSTHWSNLRALPFAQGPLYCGWDAWHHPACLPGDTRISMSDGTVRPIKEIRAGDELLSVAGSPPCLVRTGTVLAAQQTGIKSCLTIRTRRQEIRCTDDHPLLVVRSRREGFQRVADGSGRVAELCWVPAGDVRLSDRLVSVSRVMTPERPFTIRKTQTKRQENIPGRQVTPAMAELFGAWIGDGHYIKQMHSLKGISLSAYSTPTGKRWAGLIEAIGFTPTVVSEKGFEYGRVELHSTAFVKAMRWAGFIGGTREKRIPVWVYRLPLEHRLAFLRGLMDSDGSIAQRGLPRFTGVNEDLLWDCWALCKTVGMRVTHVRPAISKTGYIPNSKYFYFSSSDAIWQLIGSTKFSETISIPPVTHTATPIGPDIQAERIIKILRSDVCEPVYDIQVDPWHNFVANGVVVHNCAISTLSSMGQLRIHFAKRKDGVDIGILIDEVVSPWLVAHHLQDRKMIHVGDPTMEDGDQSNKSEDARKALLKRLPGQWTPSTNAFHKLQIAVNTILRQRLSSGEPTVMLGPDADELDESWSGGWFVDDGGKPVQRGDAGQHSHVGMAAAYLVESIFGGRAKERDWSKWARQSAMTQPWDGAGPDERSPSPAEPALARLEGGPGSAAFREKWGRQYLRDDE